MPEQLELLATNSPEHSEGEYSKPVILIARALKNTNTCPLLLNACTCM